MTRSMRGALALALLLASGCDGAENGGDLNGPPGGDGSWVTRVQMAIYSTSGTYRSVAPVSDGSVYLAGTYAGMEPEYAVFGLGEPTETRLVAPGNASAMFLARFAADGTLQWVRRAVVSQAAAGYQDLAVTKVAALSDGSAVAVGHFHGTAVFGEDDATPTVLVSADYTDGFVARYSPSGELTWVKQIVGDQNFGRSGTTDSVSAVAALPGDGVLVLGVILGPTVFGEGEANETVLEPPGGGGREPSSFIARYEADGSLSWARVFGGEGSASASGVAALPDGRFAVAGSFAGPTVFGKGEARETTLTSVESWNCCCLCCDCDMDAPSYDGQAFVARYSADGSLEWVRAAGGTCNDRARDVTLLADGAALITGAFQFTATFGAGEGAVQIEAPRNERSLFIARYEADGGLSWARAEGQMITAGQECEGGFWGAEGGRGLAALPGGGFAVTGSFEKPATFNYGEADELTLTSAGKLDLFIAGFDADGRLQWAESIGASEFDVAHDVAAAADGGLIVTGDFKMQVTFGAGKSWQTNLDAADTMWEKMDEPDFSAADIFLMRLAP